MGVLLAVEFLRNCTGEEEGEVRGWGWLRGVLLCPCAGEEEREIGEGR